MSIDIPVIWHAQDNGRGHYNCTAFINDIMDFRFEDFEIANYQSHPHIAAPVAV